jgi:transcriptional regulator with XRE-family HTH domain
MNELEAQRLGEVVRKARIRARLSYRDLAARSGIALTWLARMERGDFESPDPSRLARLAEVLRIDPKRLDRLAGGQLSDSLPEPRTYFRAKYGDLSPEQLTRLEAYVSRMRAGGGGDGDATYN